MTKRQLGEATIDAMVARGEVPTPTKVNAAIGDVYRTNQLDGHLNAYRQQRMREAGFKRAVHDTMIVSRWFPPDAEIPEGWHAD